MIALVDRTMTQVISALAIAAVFATVTLSLAVAAGKSAESPGRGAGAGSAHAGSAQTVGSAQAGSGSATIAPDTASPASGQSTNVAPDTIGTYGDLGVSHATPIGSSTYLQMDGGVNLNHETNGDMAAGLNGRVGLGLKF